MHTETEKLGQGGTEMNVSDMQSVVLAVEVPALDLYLLLECVILAPPNVLCRYPPMGQNKCTF